MLQPLSGFACTAAHRCLRDRRGPICDLVSLLYSVLKTPIDNVVIWVLPRVCKAKAG